MTHSPLPQWHDMQGIVLSAYPHLDAAEYIPLRIVDADAARTWLRDMADQVTTGSERASDATVGFTARFSREVRANVNIAIGYAGLTRLCAITPADRDTFPYAFTEGMAGNPHRSRILGDTGASDPANWNWGGAGNPVHLLLMVFADNADVVRLAAQTALKSSGVQRVLGTPLEALSLRQAGSKEHFGFVDGKSQPILTGTADAERYPESIHLTALGEFVLGYPDGVKKIAPVPRLGGFDFGTNGSYLVFRQLAQDVSRFWAFANQKACPPPGADRATAAADLASKMVGRRPDGTPLVRCGGRDDNEFDFQDDPHGYQCPVGAHIRRANPRGSLSKGPLVRESMNRHRLLRRGRLYGHKAPGASSTDDGHQRGLLFLALNGDLERQFEFISQNWINNSSFSGLDDEVDPLLGRRHPAGSRFTVPAMPARTRIDGLEDFVTLRGGEYFFLPGITALKHLAGAP